MDPVYTFLQRAVFKGIGREKQVKLPFVRDKMDQFTTERTNPYPSAKEGF